MVVLQHRARVRLLYFLSLGIQSADHGKTFVDVLFAIGRRKIFATAGEASQKKKLSGPTLHPGVKRWFNFCIKYLASYTVAVKFCSYQPQSNSSPLSDLSLYRLSLLILMQ